MVRKPSSKDRSKALKPPPSSKLPNQTVMAPVTFADDRTMTNQHIRTDNAVQKLEYAKNMAYTQSRLAINNMVRTQERSYQVLREVERCVFGYKYEVKQNNGKKYYLRTEPLTNNENMKRFKILKYELVILRRAKTLGHSASGAHFPRFHDAGATIDFKFVISQALGDTLYDITRQYMKSAFTMSTALRVAIQMLRAISDLHALGFLHRHLKPETFAIGRFSNIRTVYFSDFGEPYLYRDPETKRIRRARKQVRIIGTLRYMSRNSQLNKEHGRRDDLESWAYLAIEFFELTILPWRNDQVNSAVLDKKQKLIDGAFPDVFAKISMRFKQILRYITNMKYHERPDYGHIEKLLMDIRIEKNVDFDLPYDWENLSKMRDIIGKEPLSDVSEKSKPDARVDQPQDPIKVAKVSKPKKERTTPTVAPAALPKEKSSESEVPSLGDVTPKVPVGKVYMDKIIDVHMTGDGVNQNEKFYQEGEKRTTRSKTPQSRTPARSKSPKSRSPRHSKTSPRAAPESEPLSHTPKREHSEVNEAPEPEHSH